MPKRTARANAEKSEVRARIEHVFAHQKERIRLFIRSVGLKRAEATVTMADIACNLGRWRWWETRTASARWQNGEERPQGRSKPARTGQSAAAEGLNPRNRRSEAFFRPAIGGVHVQVDPAPVSC